jgi:hypothetical protein
MGYVRTRQGKSGKSYQAHWFDDQGRERVKTFTRKTDADTHVTLMEAAKIKGEYVDLSSKLIVAEYAAQWLASRPHRANTAARTAYAIDKHIARTKLGDRRLSAVRSSEVQGVG